jgi:hypothetical protein
MIADRGSEWHWHQCAITLIRVQALAGFDVCYWSLLFAGVLTLASACGFALAVRLERPSARSDPWSVAESGDDQSSRMR